MGLCTSNKHLCFSYPTKDLLVNEAEKSLNPVSGAYLGFLDRGFFFMYKGVGVHFADFIYFFLNIP